MLKLRIERACKSEQRVELGVGLEHGESVGDKARGCHSHSVGVIHRCGRHSHDVARLRADPLHVIFFITCTEVALVGATRGLAERKHIRIPNLFSYSITVFPASLSPSLSF